LALSVGGCAREDPLAAGSSPSPAPAPAFTVSGGASAPAGKASKRRPADRWLTARVTRAATLRAAPGGRVLARIERRTEFGSPRVLGVVGRRPGWVRVIASELPNRRRAWVRAAHVDLAATDWSLHIDRSARRLVLKRGGRRLRSLPVAVGRAGTPTPLGRYATTDELLTGRPDSPYGCCIIALSGHQTRLVEGWPGGDRLAIHATPQLDSIGKAASLGCMRARAADVRLLMRRVPLGTPVFVTA
jgi:lipoprotein-anchoring transpeptidase ErfK/SrfK